MKKIKISKTPQNSKRLVGLILLGAINKDGMSKDMKESMNQCFDKVLEELVHENSNLER